VALDVTALFEFYWPEEEGFVCLSEVVFLLLSLLYFSLFFYTTGIDTIIIVILYLVPGVVYCTVPGLVQGYLLSNCF
jgi:hypothetical protein